MSERTERLLIAFVHQEKAATITLITRSVCLDNLEFETSALRAMVTHNSACAIASGTRNCGRASQYAGTATGLASRHGMLGIFDGTVVIHAAHSTAHEKAWHKRREIHMASRRSQPPWSVMTETRILLTELKGFTNHGLPRPVPFTAQKFAICEGNLLD